MEVVRTIDELAAFAGGVLVPTMGALHEGHLTLVRHAATIGRPVVASIFVNPTQFGPGEDLARYPRPLDADLAAAAAAHADAVFVPDVETVYPSAAPVPVPPLPSVATAPGLEDASRAGHFAGVAQVVARLFDLARPRHAVFGEKDYQQLLVIEALVAAAGPRWGDLAIVRHATIREPDGLALSSRNRYLDTDGRVRALALAHALQAARMTPDPAEAERRMQETLADHDARTEYAVVRDAVTLLAPDPPLRPARALVAARVGDVRLIDNAPWP